MAIEQPDVEWLDQSPQLSDLRQKIAYSSLK